MTKKKDLVPLTIYLIKEDFSKLEDILSDKVASDPIKVSIPGAPGSLYIESSNKFHPDWLKLFSGFLTLSSIPKVSGLSALLLVKTAGRYFGLTFGNGRFLMKPDAFEERFGLLVALNLADDDGFRVVDTQSLDSIQSHTRVQSGQATRADRFGVDVEQDMLRAIVSTPKLPSVGNRMTGSDALSVSVRMDLSDLPALLKSYQKAFETDISDTKYDWVNNIAMLKSSSNIIPQLHALLLERFTSSTPSDLWLSIPEIIDWEEVKGFMYTRGRKTIHPDITLPGFLETTKGDEITIEMLNTRRVYCADESHKRLKKSWSVYKCVYAEIDFEDQKYILNGGNWFRVNPDFVANTNETFKKIALSPLELPLYNGGGEGAYNESVSVAQPDRYALLDKDTIYHGGGHGQVEICDLFSTNRELIHVKLYGESHVLSHLIAQGFVSGELIQLDSEFRQKVRDKLNAPFADLVDVASRPGDKEYTIVYAVISESPKPLHLPFFSRVNLNNTAKILTGYGYKVELLKIDWDDYAKAKKDPPEKKKKL